MNGFVMCKASPYAQWYIKFTESNRQLKFRMQTSLTHINTILEYCHALVTLDSEVILNLEDGIYINPVLKNNTATMLFVKNIQFRPS